MGAYIVYFLVGSVAAIPFLAYQLLRTRRDLSELREELRARGIVGAGGARAGAEAAPRELRASVDALAAEVARIAERQHVLTSALAERAGGPAAVDAGAAPAEPPRA